VHESLRAVGCGGKRLRLPIPTCCTCVVLLMPPGACRRSRSVEMASYVPPHAEDFCFAGSEAVEVFELSGDSEDVGQGNVGDCESRTRNERARYSNRIRFFNEPDSKMRRERFEVFGTFGPLQFP
jgi:hypothetical protein